jgi:ABC-2 type transport system ATP-binding protein
MQEKQIPILECTSLTKRYGSSIALQDLTLTIPRGKIVGLLGPNGSGKTTLIKLISGLLTPSEGVLRISGLTPGIESKRLVSYLPDCTYLCDWMKARDIIALFADFYEDFDSSKAKEMLQRLEISADMRLKNMSKGTKEKVQLVLVMSRRAELYLLDEPIGGVDPAARDYILNTIITNYSENSTVLISTHLIYDIERVLEEFVFLSGGRFIMQDSVDNIRETQGKSIDQLFREVFRC